MLPINTPQRPVNDELRFLPDGTCLRFVQDGQADPGIGVWVYDSRYTTIRRTTSTVVTTTTVVPLMTTRSAASHSETSHGAVRHRHFIPLPRTDDDTSEAQQ